MGENIITNIMKVSEAGTSLKKVRKKFRNRRASLRGRRKKGRERGREISTKEGKGKGAPAIRADVLIRPPFSQLIL